MKELEMYAYENDDEAECGENDENQNEFRFNVLPQQMYISRQLR